MVLGVFDGDPVDFEWVLLPLFLKPARFASRGNGAIYDFLEKYFWKISDPLCGMKAYKLQFLINHGPFDTIKGIGAEFSIKLIKAGVIMTEIDIVTKPRLDKSRYRVTFLKSEKNRDNKRFGDKIEIIGKYFEKINSTDIRELILEKDKKRFYKYLPDKLKEEDRLKIWNIVN